MAASPGTIASYRRTGVYFLSALHVNGMTTFGHRAPGSRATDVLCPVGDVGNRPSGLCKEIAYVTVSLWQETAAPPIAVSHDVVVVGAGLVGSYLSGLLTEAGKDVAMVEARFPAGGASGRNAGFVHLGTRHFYNGAIERFGHAQAREVWSLTVENVSRMRQLAKKYGVGHEEKGAVFVSVNTAQSADLSESTRMLQRDGFTVDFVDHDPLDRGYLAAMIQPDDFAVQPAQLTHALVRESGATLYENDEVAEIRRDGSSLLVRSRQRLVRCEKVVLAVNGYAGLLHPFFRPLVEPARGQVLLTEPLPRILDTIGTEHHLCYFQQLPDGRLLVGGGRYQYIEQERTYSDEITPQVQNVIRQFIARRFPEVNVEVSRQWAGIHGITTDGLPIIGHLPEEPEVYFVVGFSGHGNSMGLMAAERTAEMMLNGSAPGVFSVGRFE